MRLFRSVAATTVAVSALLLCGSQAFAMQAATAAAPKTAAPRLAAPGADFTGIAALSNCSASLVRYAESVSTDKALVLTNGHCYENGFLSPGQVLVNKSSTRQITLLRPSSSNAGTVRATRILYGTMTKTDVILYEVNESYASIKSRLNVTPLTLAKQGPADGAGMAVVSGYWKRIYTCSVQATIPRLREGNWTWQNSIKYLQPGCETIGGTSGSPIVSTSNGEVIGINNTGNEDGERCTVNNPCEVDANGNVTVDQGAAYGEQTWWFYTCLTATRTIDLNKSGCQLVKPARR
ncbi:trypsin-like peptidase domain-containing protein [Kribbella qitaiheensis]|uniref:Trypsin-like peptidase domain-containing protein n=1 Tax=Kribbella qitaiheensis TaxID=1544730 RepID=A0A7G6X3X2_9ACTN|nr:serine protease [Kribbella qitaiheensis]QNE20937.1 trypsin-like peptidase domain-containing protein [Kribbella qitaiheensis]